MKKAKRIPELDLIIADIRCRVEFHFFKQHLVLPLPLTVLSFFPGLLVFELAILAPRRPRSHFSVARLARKPARSPVFFAISLHNAVVIHAAGLPQSGLLVTDDDQEEDKDYPYEAWRDKSIQ